MVSAPGLRSPTPDPVRRRAASISAVVPVYREAENIARVIEELGRALERLAERFEIVLVDDGSRDATRSEVLALASRWSIHYLELSRRFGKESALSAGLAVARGEVVVLLDGDGQHPVDVLPEMLEKWRDGFDMVYGLRRDRDEENLTRRLGARLLYGLLSWGSEIEIPPHAGDFRLMDRCVVDALNALPERTRFMKGLYAWVGFRSCAVEFDVRPRPAGQTRFPLRRLVQLALSGITGFSTLPLQCVSAFGLVVSVFALGYGAWVAIEELVYDIDLPGYPTLVVSIMFFAGVQLISMGILGHYLGRVFDEVKRRPSYIVANSVDRSTLGAARQAEAPV